MDDLRWLQDWYKRHCNGDWEHGDGVKITTLDNPGWSLRVSLAETELETIDFQSVKVEHSDHDWYFCRREGLTFAGSGGPENLVDLIRELRTWVAKNPAFQRKQE